MNELIGNRFFCLDDRCCTSPLNTHQMYVLTEIIGFLFIFFVSHRLFFLTMNDFLYILFNVDLVKGFS